MYILGSSKLIVTPVSGVKQEYLKRMYERHSKLLDAMNNGSRPVQVLPPPYVRKFPALPILQSYKGNFTTQYWSLWPENKALVPCSWISADALKDVAQTLGYNNKPALNKAVEILSSGASLGVTEEGRVPWAGENYSSAYEHGSLVSDTLCEWLDQGVVSGPWKEEEVVGKIPFLRIHPMSCQLKPTGSPVTK